MIIYLSLNEIKPKSDTEKLLIKITQTYPPTRISEGIFLNWLYDHRYTFTKIFTYQLNDRKRIFLLVKVREDNVIIYSSKIDPRTNKYLTTYIWSTSKVSPIKAKD